jgi:hypothetical protein
MLELGQDAFPAAVLVLTSAVFALMIWAGRVH